MMTSKTLSQTEIVYRSIRDDILSCKLAPGSKLKINELCEKYAASLGAVREALSRLCSEELIISEAQKGFRVSPISTKDLQDLANTRIHIESLCLEQAINKGDLSWESNIVASLHRLNHLPERQANAPELTDNVWEEAHNAFHNALIASCDSYWLQHIRKILSVQNERYRRLSAVLDQHDRDLKQEHQHIANAVLERNIKMAQQYIGDHILTTTQIVLGNFDLSIAEL
ncbi:GntR family transcriptional regulator [Acinetobacter ihumii]|uniref:GntR family transcriptional regulator n=1 Tax=Acinetobacter ihumii TaxID=2483802 RepID=UPI0013EF5AC1|nr:GntR family transcriptional regulator [Acinetobacter ihumii]